MEICALFNADVDDKYIVVVKDVDKNNLLDNNYSSFNYFQKPMPSGINDFF